MPLTYVRTFRARHYECDASGYVKHANYPNYMQEAAFDASAAAGYDVARYEVMGSRWLVRETDIEYLHPLRYGDSVQVKTWVADFRRVRSRRAYELRLVESDEVVSACQHRLAIPGQRHGSTGVHPTRNDGGLLSGRCAGTRSTTAPLSTSTKPSARRLSAAAAGRVAGHRPGTTHAI